MNPALARAVDRPADSPLDMGALRLWLRSPDRLAADGRVLSWSNVAHPGYPYDEATAVFAHLFRWTGDSERAQACIDVLQTRLATDGWLGRDGVHYVFDTALALPLLNDATLSGAVVAAIEEGVVCRPITRPGHWSQVPGPHLLKCAFWLARVGRDVVAMDLADRLIASCFDAGRFRIAPGSPHTYLHSHCYALEGLLGLRAWLRSRGRNVPLSHERVLSQGVQWLADVQHGDGGLPGSVGAESSSCPSDVLAQALRLWSAVGPVVFAGAIGAAEHRLAARQDPETGGIFYDDTSADACSWVGAFALQAAEWVRVPPSTGEILCLI